MSKLNFGPNKVPLVRNFRYFDSKNVLKEEIKKKTKHRCRTRIASSL